MTTTKRCYVCQKNQALPGLIYCQECDDRVKDRKMTAKYED